MLFEKTTNKGYGLKNYTIQVGAWGRGGVQTNANFIYTIKVYNIHISTESKLKKLELFGTNKVLDSCNII